MTRTTIASGLLLLSLHAASATAASDEAWRPEAWPSEQHLEHRRTLSESGRWLVPSEPFTKATGMELALAMGLDPARLQSPVVSGPAGTTAVLPSLGIIQPLEGSSMAFISTGLVQGAAPEPGTDFTPTGSIGDLTVLVFDIAVPPGPGRLSFSYLLLTTEFPEFIRAGFDDRFITTLEDDAGTRTIAEISVDSANLFPVSNAAGAGTGFDLFADDPQEIDTVFGPGGLPDAGLTRFLLAEAPFQSTSGSIQLVFGLRDGGDGLLDSAVLLDNLVVSRLEIVDVNPDLLAGGSVVTDRALLATLGEARRGAAADGVTQLLSRMQTSGPGDVTFSVDGRRLDDGGFVDPTASLPVESLTVAVGPDNFAFAVYQVPNGLERAGSDDRAERSVTLKASFQPSGGGAPFDSVQQLLLVRPPVVFTHGIWSEPETWQFPLANDSRFRVKRFTDYGETSGRSFSVNLPLVIEEIEQALEVYRLKRIAATQVDAVGHSMGGLLSRWYTNRPDYRRNENFNAGTIRRIFTVDTPHTGSPLATLLVGLREQPQGVGLTAAIAFDALRMPIGEGAIQDLAKGSAALAAIGASDAPGQALVGTGGSDTVGVVPGRLGAAYLVIALLTGQTPAEVFAGLQHDAIVGRPSQEGGLDSAFLSLFGGVHGLHFGVPAVGIPGNTASSLYSDRLLELLRVREQTSFAPFPAPSSLSSFAETLEELPATKSLAKVASSGGDGLQITSPPAGFTVVPGATVTVAVEPLAGVDVERVVVVGPFTAAGDDEAPFEVELEIPIDLAGPLTVVAIGVGNGGTVAYLSEGVDLAAQPAATLIAVDLLPKEPIAFTPGLPVQLRAIGVYDDGVRRDLTRFDTTFISLVEGIAAVSADGLLTAGDTGLTTILARNGGLQDSVTVEVVEAPDLVFRDGFESGDLSRWTLGVL